MSTKRIISIVAILLLLFNAAGALYGGWLLMVDSTGTKLKLSPSVLKHTPFPDFLLPGVMLFAVQGILSLLVTTAVLTKMRRAPLLVTLEGFLLTGWIVIEFCWTQFYHPLQAVMLCVGLLLTGCGVLLFRIQKKEFQQWQRSLRNQVFHFN
ncbi:MAG TPA: hypothetical protein VFL47_04475 [Flavisolibacter sp.]|nr:hypothetical protein [Flavisolibacter sp.]